MRKKCYNASLKRNVDNLLKLFYYIKKKSRERAAGNLSAIEHHPTNILNSQGVPIFKGWGSRRTFQGLKERVWYLLEYSLGPQRERLPTS